MSPGSSALAASVNSAPLAVRRSHIRPARGARARRSPRPCTPARQPTPMATNRLMVSSAAIARPASPARQPVKRPTGSAWATAICTSSPPQRARQPTQAACVSSVTALTTSRPPGGSASQRALDHAGRARAAADEDGVRRRQILKHVRRLARDDGERGARRSSARCGRCARRGRGGLRSRRRDWRDRPASIRSRPSPSRRRRPTAVSPRRGASAESVIARMSRLVIWPSCSNHSSGRPRRAGQDARVAVGDDLERDGVERGDVVEREALRLALRGCARAGRPSPRRPSARTAPCRAPRAAPRAWPGSHRPRRAPGSGRRAADAG